MPPTVLRCSSFSTILWPPKSFAFCAIGAITSWREAFIHKVSPRNSSRIRYVEGESLTDMIKEDLVAERIAIETYRDIIQYLSNHDPTTRRMMEGILAVEEQRPDELAGRSIDGCPLN